MEVKIEARAKRLSKLWDIYSYLDLHINCVTFWFHFGFDKVYILFVSVPFCFLMTLIIRWEDDKFMRNEWIDFGCARFDSILCKWFFFWLNFCNILYLLWSAYEQRKGKPYYFTDNLWYTERNLFICNLMAMNVM